MSLPSGLQRIADRAVDFFEKGGEAPYQLYVYEPSEEWAVRRELRDLKMWLEAPPRGIFCAAISLADIFWQALSDQGWLDELVAQEREAQANPVALSELNNAVAEVLRQEPTLPSRVISAVDALDAARREERLAVFLYRAGALYPAYRTSSLLEDLLGRVRRPVTLLYPGTAVGQGVRFMGVCEPTYGYRALKVVRGDSK